MDYDQLSGAAMSVIHSQTELKDKLLSASSVSPDYPVVITKMIENAEEIDVDAVASAGKLLVHAVSEHVEAAGVHSGDATLVLPPANLDESIMARVKDIAEKVAKAWSITGPFNMQIIKANSPDSGEPLLKVIECNLRASRSFPFVSKVLGKQCFTLIGILNVEYEGHRLTCSTLCVSSREKANCPMYRN